MTTRVLVGDCRATLATLDASSVQCCVTSPPYYGLRDYGAAGQIGLEPTPAEYVAQMVDVFRAVRRVLRPDGTLWLNLGDSYAGSSPGWSDMGEADLARRAAAFGTGRGPGAGPRGKQGAPRGMGDAKPKDLLGIPWRVAFALQADGWWLRSAVVWHKPNPMPESITDRPTSAHEMVFLLAPSPAYFYDAEAIAEPAIHAGRVVEYDGTQKNSLAAEDPRMRTRIAKTTAVGATRNCRNVWTIATQPYAGAHFATMPPDLAERCIKAGTSERGACPACGAPWARDVERERIAPAMPSGNREIGTWLPKQEHVGGRMIVHDRGFAPSCDCPPAPPVPQLVLDPFGGAGTTALVADRLGRDAVICELNPTYAALARDRITGDAPLFASVAE